MAFASGSRHGLRYVPEAVFRTDPANYTATKDLRYVSCTIGLTKDNFVSNEIRSDRQITDLTHGAQRVGGEIGIELSYGEYDDLFAQVLGASWTNNVLKAGTSLGSFQFERAFTDIAKYGLFKGCMVNTLSLSIPANAMVTGSFGIIGASGSYVSSAMYATPAASLTNSPFNSFSGEIEEGGVVIAIVTSINIQLTNNLEPLFVVGSDLSPAISSGRSNLTGTISAYFPDLTLIDKFINGTETSVTIQLGDTEDYYVFDMSRVKYTGADNPVNGEGPIVINMPFQALRDSSDASNIVITRYPSS